MTKKPGIMIAVGVGPKKPSGGMPMPAFPGKKTAPKAPEPEAANDGDLDDGGGIPPEAVSYRSADQKCGSCTFHDGGQCSKLQMPVEEDAGCNLYDAAGDDMGAGEQGDMGMGGQGNSYGR